MPSSSCKTRPGGSVNGVRIPFPTRTMTRLAATPRLGHSRSTTVSPAFPCSRADFVQPVGPMDKSDRAFGTQHPKRNPIQSAQSPSTLRRRGLRPASRRRGGRRETADWPSHDRTRRRRCAATDAPDHRPSPALYRQGRSAAHFRSPATASGWISMPVTWQSGTRRARQIAAAP